MGIGLLLNVGSGQRKFASPWINLDVNMRWHPDVVADGALMPMFDDNSADCIVLHQVYEHFGLGEAGPLVRECHRILKPGASLIVTTPNLRALVDRWIAARIDDYTFCVNLYGAYMDSEADRHKWLYTPETLWKSLNEPVRWSAVIRYNFRPLEGADIAQDWWIQGAEAIK